MRATKPATLAEAISLLAANPEAKILAGGTDLLPRLNQKLERHDLLCCIEDLPELQGLSQRDDGSICIGASIRLWQLAELALTEAPALAKASALAGYTAILQAAAKVASPQIRNQATLGGNLLQENRCMFFNNQVPWSDVNKCFKWGGNQCFQYKGSKECVALFQSDLAPAMMAYGAQAVLAGPGGQRRLPLPALYLSAGRKAIDHAEILTGIELPPLQAGARSAYRRWTIRGSFDFPLVSCAVCLKAEGGIVADCAVVFGSAGVMPKAIDTGPVIGMPAGNAQGLAEALIPLTSKAVAPFRDTRINAGVRVDMAKDCMKKALAAVCSS